MNDYQYIPIKESYSDDDLLFRIFKQGDDFFIAIVKKIKEEKIIKLSPDYEEDNSHS